MQSSNFSLVLFSWIPFAVLGIACTWESFFPRRLDRENLWGRWSLHLGLFFFNTSVAALIWRSTVLTNLKSEPPSVLEIVSLILFLDFISYWTHRAFHRWLASVHNVHHSDKSLDSSTALRSHWLQSVLAGGIEVSILILWQPSLYSYSAFLTLFYSSLFFHHGNYRLPPKLEDVLSWIWVTPSWHWNHHLMKENTSHFGNIFSFWDRIFVTATPSPETHTLGSILKSRSDRLRYFVT